MVVLLSHAVEYPVEDENQSYGSRHVIKRYARASLDTRPLSPQHLVLQDELNTVDGAVWHRD